MSKRADKKASDTLLEARELLTRRGWTKGYLGRSKPDQYGNTHEVIGMLCNSYAVPLTPENRRKLRKAAAFCLVGAVKAANGPRELDALESLDCVVEGWELVPGQYLAPRDPDAGGYAFYRVWKYNDSRSTPEHAFQAIDAAYVLALQEEGLEPEDVLG